MAGVTDRSTSELNNLVQAFALADSNNDEQELIAIIQLLESCKWNVDDLSLFLKLEHHYCIEPTDRNRVEDLFREVMAGRPDPNLTDNEKMERVIAMANSPLVAYDYNQMKSIVENLSSNDVML